MKKLEVRAGAQHYEVLIGPGLFAQAGHFVRQIRSGRRCAVLSDEKVAALYGKAVCERLREADFSAELLTFPAGEASKTLSQAGALCDQLGVLGFDRSSFLLALGGGVVGDVAGFVASIYLRGLPYMSLPTTLLAQVDSCIGGKTGVNSAHGKNLLGSIHHPSLVLADTETLTTLPERILHEGVAEAIKHGVIRDAELFRALEIGKLVPDADFVARNLRIKAAIVAADEREQNDLRALLNFGHTVGHGLELAAGYGNMLHGEAVSLGIVAAAQVSVRRAGLSLGEAERIRSALAAHHLPTQLPENFPREKILAAIKRDKKFVEGRIRFVVAHKIGHAELSSEVTMEDLQSAIDSL